MKEDIKYYVVKKKAVPEVLLKVVEAKRLLDSEKGNDCPGGDRDDRNQPQFFL